LNAHVPGHHPQNDSLADMPSAANVSTESFEGHEMERLGRDAPLPREMQGRWTNIEDSTSELIVQGGEVSCFGKPVAYDFKLVGNDDGALTVSLKIEDEAAEDTFQRANITELVITPEGDLHAYNVKFASQFTRVD
jgi:hypothetical protein